MAKSRDCPICAAKMKHGTRSMEFPYKDQVVVLEQPGWWCTKCDEGVIMPEDAAVTEPAFVAFKAHVEGVLTPSEVRFARERLGLSQRKAGEILGGGARAFYKYEHGETMVSRPMSNLLRLLVRDPSRLSELSMRKAG